MTSYEFERALVYLAEQIIKTFGEDVGTPGLKQEPVEPLIKDEKIRKAVRAWAEAESEDCYYGQDATTLYNGSGDHIEFWSRPFKDLTPYEHYTIGELCGEKEE